MKTGKLSHEILSSLLDKHVKDLDRKDERIIQGSKIGEDAAVIDIPGEKYLVAKTDPITFTTDQIGYYVVNVNVNDIVCTGAEPKWFQSTILLPEKKTSKSLIERIFRQIHDACKTMNISVIGGHTEITTGLNKPIIIGMLLGEVKKDKLVNTSGVKPGDSLILTKGIFIEGTSIIAREKQDFLRKHNFNQEFIEKCKNFLYNPGISVYKEARLAHNHFKINGMHDPTEGGLACGIAEMAIASNAGVIIEEDKIEILPESEKLSKIFNLNPLGIISSGSLLIGVDEELTKDVINLLVKNNIKATKIGEFVQKDNGLKIINKDKQITNLKYSEIDEIIKIF
ncbi:MAG: hydrogenase expression/formation protein [Candidatus Lokiarchaeota archaeon]|nr:hydrogenase expression/formation protein [Candidatus Lokiarchaeota archaeon]MBD3198819.1 hydrogenase expression/formation protein [Candidatus Lokiarchaeota archaeon]